ncbi:hypothetical protein OQA88_13380 [Cercophora sp. LCS_1]
MASRCERCAGLSMKVLVDLAEEEFGGHHFPSHAFYSHHQSFHDLEEAANNGCEFCQFVIDLFKGTPGGFPTRIYPKWLTADGTHGNIKSAYTVAKAMKKSDVKIALGCNSRAGISTRVPLWTVGAFDVLMIQVGPEYEMDIGDNDEYEITTLREICLTITTPPGEPVSIGRYRIGRSQLDPDLGSQANYDVAKSWLRECKASHPQCRPRLTSQLPTRVIDVGTAGDLEVRVIQPSGVYSPYATLSHCWGGPIQTVLTTSSLPSFTTGLPVSTLPANFQDAIAITRQLGLQYLWIDSLCILQDSKEDWEIESKNMGGIYLNSEINISAMSSKGSTSGILRHNPPPRLDPKPAYIQINPNDPDGPSVRLERQLDLEEDLGRLDRYSPLSQRSWTLQESLLARRHICYGEEQIFWRCPEGFKSADGLLQETKLEYQAPTKMYPQLLWAVREDLFFYNLTQAQKRPIFDEYYALIETYSERQLTFASDKLPALSGLARRLHYHLEGFYLAGLWSEDLHRGLLWKVHVGNLVRAEPYRAPSWSWAVTDQVVLYNGPKLLARSGVELRLLEVDITPRNENNRFGEIAEARIVVRGLTMPLVRSAQVVEALVGGSLCGRGEWDCQEGATTMPWEAGKAMGVVPVDGDGGQYLFSFLNMQHTVDGLTGVGLRPSKLDYEVRSEGDYVVLLVQLDERARGVCLVLKPVAGSDGSFERVGLLTVEAGDGMDWLSWKEQTMKLV